MKENVTQVEMGGGFMVADNMSVGFKVDYTAKGGLMTEDDTTTWVQANYYF